jgi:hypothetical protein
MDVWPFGPSEVVGNVRLPTIHPVKRRDGITDDRNDGKALTYQAQATRHTRNPSAAFA